MTTQQIISKEAVIRLRPYLDNNHTLAPAIVFSLGSFSELDVEIKLLERQISANGESQNALDSIFSPCLKTDRKLKERAQATLQIYSILQSPLRRVPPGVKGLRYSITAQVPQHEPSMLSVEKDHLQPRKERFSKSSLETLHVSKAWHKGYLEDLVSIHPNAFAVVYDTLAIEGQDFLAVALRFDSWYPYVKQLYLQEDLREEAAPLADRLAELPSRTAFHSLQYLKFDENIEINYDPPLRLSTLASLSVPSISGDRGNLSTILLSLPVLEELEALSSLESLDHPEDDVWIHLPVKRLVMNDERTLYQPLYALLSSLETRVLCCEKDNGTGWRRRNGSAC
ncbi:hypothetical protein BKA70DRAFT_1238446 [Coprinopsis sp. MPI-PUGE-AT-0042]|nr:hypothetical protein BKA70DRAFT_1238446 [Coprinopsis sp. MPI-PUGE-AT-0042]